VTILGIFGELDSQNNEEQNKMNGTCKNIDHYGECDRHNNMTTFLYDDNLNPQS